MRQASTAEVGTRWKEESCGVRLCKAGYASKIVGKEWASDLSTDRD